MPLLNPSSLRIDAALVEAGILSAPSAKQPEEEEKLSEVLSQVGLSKREVCKNLSDLANYSGKEEIRLKANETALKLHGGDIGSSGIKINFNIISKEGYSVNSILIPQRG